MVNASELYGAGGDFLNVDMARADKLLNKWITVKNAEVRDMTETDFKTKEEKQVKKIVLSFNEMDYELPLNKTNARRLIADVSPETDNWIGRPIKLKVQMWSNGKEGLVIKSKQELADDGDEAPTSSSSSEQPISTFTEQKPTLKMLADKYQAINIACGRVSKAGFDMDAGNVYSELTKMQRDGDIFSGELDQYKALLGV